MTDRIDYTDSTYIQDYTEDAIKAGAMDSTVLKDILSVAAPRKIDEAGLKAWSRGIGAPILTRKLTIGGKEVENKINNKIQHNFPKRLTRIRTGYLAGNPVQYSINEQEFTGTEQQLKEAQYRLKEFYIKSNMSNIHSETVSDNTSIGQAGRLLYIDNTEPNNPIVKAMFVEGESCIFVGKGVHPIFSIRLIDSDNIDVYDDSSIYHYTNASSDIVLSSTEEHNLSSNPLIPYYNNIDTRGNFEDSLGKINDVDEQRSNLSSLFTNQRLAMKIFTDLDVDDNAIEQNIQQGTLSIKTKDGKGSFHTEQIIIPSEPLERHIEELERSIYLDAGITNIEDKQFGNESGEAKKYYLIPMESNCKDTETKHRASDLRMLTIWADYWRSLGVSVDPINIDVVWNRNLPVSRKDDADWLTAMEGRAPRAFVYSKMDTIENPEQLASQFEEENEALSYEEIATKRLEWEIAKENLEVDTKEEN